VDVWPPPLAAHPQNRSSAARPQHHPRRLRGSDRAAVTTEGELSTNAAMVVPTVEGVVVGGVAVVAAILRCDLRLGMVVRHLEPCFFHSRVILRLVILEILRR
jgi:hypothetical protein